MSEAAACAAGAPPSPTLTGEIQALFGDRRESAERYAASLAAVGVTRGLIGPREAERIWERHLLNCAALGELLPPNQRIVDVGSGAGLPGLPLAISRPDLRVDLVEPLARRVKYLAEVVAELGLAERVRVVRGRAEEPAVRELVGDSAWVSARAVAPLDRLARWCLPLLAPGGRLLAMKGSTATSEVATHREVLARAGVTEVEVVSCGVGILRDPTTVVVARVGTSTASRATRSRGASARARHR